MRKLRKHWRWWVAALAAAALLPAFPAPAQEDGYAELDRLVQQFAEVYSVVEAQAADPISSFRAFYSGAIPGMLKRLDPHSVFFAPDQFAQLNELQKATRKGFGSVVSLLPGRVFVLQTLPATPSARSGMEPGDEILAINGIALARLNVDQLVSLLSQSRRRQVNLAIRRAGASRLIEITMEPTSMESASVDLAFALRKGIGYLRVKSFESNTGREVKKTIERLGGNGLRGLILDLRQNRGGIMAAALETASLFLEPGQVIVSVRGRVTKSEEIKVPDGATPYRFPVAVLISGESASGAEIVAGALQDHDRAAIVGLPSFGKGLVQNVFPLSEGTGLALTTAFYYTPSGRSIQRPLKGFQLSKDTIKKETVYHTDDGRPVSGGGGIQPDYVVFPAPMSRLRIVLEASGSFPTFATKTIRKLGAIDETFEVDSGLLDGFQAWLADRNIQPSISKWSLEREWIRSRLRQEIFNQALGVAQGDQLEIERDPQVRKALEIVQK